MSKDSKEIVFGTGKLPNRFLDSLLSRYGSDDPRVIVRPGVGLDAAVLELGEQLLVAKSDPITFATDQIGWYAVHVNANDIACMGATPHWFLATILLPDQSSASFIEMIFAQIHEACESLGVSLVGGHTEMSYGLQRPLISGTMLGTVSKERLVTPEKARPGDLLVIAQGIPIEATAIIAYERADTLRELGWQEEEIEAAQHFLREPGISVVEAARVATEAVPLHGMHDPTEGGVATGLREMAQAAGLGLWVDADALPILPIADRLCKEFDINPLGAIASGALLLAVAPEHGDTLLSTFEGANIPASIVGELTEESGAWLVSDGNRIPLPEFTVDEITKLF
ncbi:MAG: AIR synthase family protein [Chloroflexota bacterium]|nr:AIR synthase family protein [Chloroflexota bacterium]